jgi:hypothetical protein
MKRTVLKSAQSHVADDDNYAAMGEALVRLYRAAQHTIGDVVGRLSASERAKLAVYCYGRTHLNAIGLAIAAECDVDHLIAASSSSTAGRALFTRSRELPTSSDRPLTGRRNITLATSVSRAFAMRMPEQAEPAEELI